MNADQANVAGGVAAGTLAIFLAEAGLTAADLGYAALGTGLGTVSTKGLPRFQALFLFVGLTVISALAARWCAQMYFPAGGDLTSRLLAAVFGVVSYGVRVQVLRTVPALWDALILRRVGAGPAEKDTRL